MKISLSDATLRQAAESGTDAFLQTVVDAIAHQAGGTLTADALAQLSPDQITLWAYVILRDELCDGGFIQLIHNGYGPFFFLNPFAKAMRLWGLKDFSKLLYRAREFTNCMPKRSHSPAQTRSLWHSTSSFPSSTTSTTPLWSEKKNLPTASLII